MPSSVSRAVVVTLGLAAAVVSLTAQTIAPIGARVSSSGNALLSPSVVATYLMAPGGGDLVKLEALVFWRGRPGWSVTTLRAPAGGGVSSAILGPLSIGVGGATTTVMNGVELTVRVDRDKSLVFVRDQAFDLRTSNVILVDAVDEGARASVVDSLRIEAQVPFTPGADMLLPIVNSSPELKAFLRCDDTAGGRTPTPMTNICPKVQR